MKSLLLASFIFFTSLAFAGGPWSNGKRNGYFQLGFTGKNWDGRYEGTYANTFFRDLNRSISETDLILYGEYGLTDKLTLVSDLSFRMMSTSSETLEATENPFDEILAAGSLNAFGNPGFLLKFQLGTQKLASAIYGRFQPNISSRNADIGLQSDFDANTYTVGLFLGQGFSRGYWSFDAGLAIKSNNYAESVLGNFQYGYRIRPKTYLIFDLNYMFSLENGTNEAGAFAQTATFIDNQGYVAYGAKIYSQFYKNISFNLAFYSGFAVINQGNQPGGIFGGLAYELNKND